MGAREPQAKAQAPREKPEMAQAGRALSHFPTGSPVGRFIRFKEEENAAWQTATEQRRGKAEPDLLERSEVWVC